MLKIWGRVNSSNVQKVLWTCDTLGVPFERIDAGMQFGVNNTPEYRAMNPNGRVPTIEDDGFVLWESNAIMRYLCAKHDHQHLLMPHGLQERADADRWMDWSSTTLGPAITPLFWGLIRTPVAERKPEAIAAARSETAKCFAMLDAALATRQFVAGERLTMGDIPNAIQVYRWFEMLGVYAATETRPAMPHLAAWYARLKQNAGFAKWVMQPIT